MRPIFTFTSDGVTRPGQSISRRPSVIERIADLGELAGTPAFLLGIAMDINWPSAGEAQIYYGLATGFDIAGIESRIGCSLLSAMNEGKLVEATVRLTQSNPGKAVVTPPILIGLAAMQQEGQVVSIKVDPRFEGLPPSDDRKVNWSAAVDQMSARDAFRLNLEHALKLRRKPWNLEEMKTRQDFISWLPVWAKNEIRNSSRFYLELSNAVPPPAVSPPPQHVEAIAPSMTPATPATRAPGLLARLTNLIAD